MIPNLRPPQRASPTVSTGAVLITLGLMLFAPQRADALILTGQGNQPVSDPGWPGGALAVANLTNRVGWAEGPPFGGGQWTFFYRGNPTDLQKALEAFAAIKADRLEIVLHAGTAASPFLGGAGDNRQSANYDWSFEVWVPENWNRLYNDPQSFFSADQPNFRQPVAAPRLDIWLSPGRLEWAGAQVPAKVTVRDDRATSHGFKPGAGSVIRASVTDAANAQPVPGARLVVLSNENGRWQKVDEAVGNAEGRVQLAGLKEGSYRVVADAVGYVPRVLDFVRFGTNDYREYAVALARPAGLSGLVRDEAGKPLSGVKVRAGNILGPDGKGYPMPETPEVESDAEGRFQLKGLPVGLLQVFAHREGYHQRWNPSDLVQVLGPGAGTQLEYAVRMEPTGAVSVQIVDGDRKPIRNLRDGEVQVHIEASEGPVVGSWGGGSSVGTNGVCVFEGVPPGQYRVSGKPFVPGSGQGDGGAVAVTVEAGKTAHLELVKP
jgi:hypothetical protein